VFILPPSMAELERRLQARAEDAPEVIARRMARSQDEISHWEEYDYVLVNTRIEETLAQLKQILAAERLKRHRQAWLKLHVERLKAGK
jgi:guanylate kinase